MRKSIVRPVYATTKIFQARAQDSPDAAAEDGYSPGQGQPTFKVTGLRARYPDAPTVPKSEWTLVIGLPIPDDTTSLPQKVDGIEVKIETWPYGTVAQILYLGAYDQEKASIERLLKFIRDSGYETAGDHEEEYLTRPDAKVPKTIIRYVVTKRR